MAAPFPGILIPPAFQTIGAPFSRQGQSVKCVWKVFLISLWLRPISSISMGQTSGTKAQLQFPVRRTPETGPNR